MQKENKKKALAENVTATVKWVVEWVSEWGK